MFRDVARTSDVVQVKRVGGVCNKSGKVDQRVQQQQQRRWRTASVSSPADPTKQENLDQHRTQYLMEPNMSGAMPSVRRIGGSCSMSGKMDQQRQQQQRRSDYTPKHVVHSMHTWDPTGAMSYTGVHTYEALTCSDNDPSMAWPEKGVHTYEVMNSGDNV